MRNIYIVGVAVFYALVVGFGIATFYVAPQRPPAPEPPAALKGAPPPPDYYSSPEYQRYFELQQSYQDELREYEPLAAAYNRNLFYIAAVLGLVVMIGSVVSPQTLGPIRPGIALGGLLTVFYGVARYFNDMNDAWRFALAVVGLVALLYVGYTRLRQRLG